MDQVHYRIVPKCDPQLHILPLCEWRDRNSLRIRVVFDQDLFTLINDNMAHFDGCIPPLQVEKPKR